MGHLLSTRPDEAAENPMRRIEVHLRRGDKFDLVLRAVKHFEPIDYSIVDTRQEDRVLVNVFMRDGTSQDLVDAIQSVLEDEADWRLNVIAIEATLPKLQERDEEREQRNTQAIREEMLGDIAQGAVLDRDFAILVTLSTIVAAVAMNTESVAGVIGAMVIAPLLGPILAFAMGTALGDHELLRKSGLTLAAGIMFALLAALAIALIVPINLQSSELMSRAEVRLDSLALALAAGGAAALNAAKGRAGPLVGVMVAAALLPPGAAMGMFLGSGMFDLGARAGLLLLLNVACLILAALVTFRLRDIQPRKWIEQKNAKRAVWLNISLSATFLLIAAVLIVYFDLGTEVSLPTP